MQGLRIFQMWVRGVIPTKIIISTVLLIFLSGCGGVSESALNSVLEKDPAFRKILDAKKRAKEKIASLQSEMEPKIEALKLSLGEARAEYKAKAALVKNSGRKLKSIKKLLSKKNDLALSGDEISIWNKRIVDLEEEIISLKRDIEDLRNKAHLFKTEIRILQD